MSAPDSISTSHADAISSDSLASQNYLEAFLRRLKNPQLLHQALHRPPAKLEIRCGAVVGIIIIAVVTFVILVFRKHMLEARLRFGSGGSIMASTPDRIQSDHLSISVRLRYENVSQSLVRLNQILLKAGSPEAGRPDCYTLLFAQDYTEIDNEIDNDRTEGTEIQTQIDI